MAARKAWMVFVDHPDYLYGDNNVAGKYNPHQDSSDIMSVFFREAYAVEWAKAAAIRYPGRDVHVLKQAFGFSSQPKPPEYKEWTEDGHFIPSAK